MADEHDPNSKTYQIGRSRPPLEVEDLPTPEEVFKVKRIRLEELLLYVLGPSVIALGISLGSGEWMLGPLNIGLRGFQGIGWVILVSAVLQVFYIVEVARFTLATGEAPILAFGRTPPHWVVWVPLALFSFYSAFILGGWATSASQSLFALIVGRPSAPAEAELVRILAIALLLTTYLFVIFGRKIERTLEASQGVFMAFLLIGLTVVTLVVVPLNVWGQAWLSLVTFTAPPKGTDPSLLGSLAGFTALASGLNFMVVGYYRDKGYGMGAKVGYLSGWIGGKGGTLSASGKIFPEDQKNAIVWKRWFRYLLIDQWGVYFIGCLIGILVPSILVSYLSKISGAEALSSGTIITYAATQLGQRFGPVLFGWALLMGFGMLWTTQIVVLELLVRNMTDAVYGLSGRVRQWLGHDPRKFYYGYMLFLIVVIGVILHLTSSLPALVVSLSGNLSNFAALVFPFVMMYLNSRLPKPAKITWWSYLVLLANALFFGFFFLNFVSVTFFKVPLVELLGQLGSR